MTKADAEGRTIARDFVMARLAATRIHLQTGLDLVDEAIAFFVDPSDDKKGKHRSEILEGIDAAAGDAARSVQLAQAAWEDVDASEGEPEPDDDDDDDDNDDDDDDDDDEEDE